MCCAVDRKAASSNAKNRQKKGYKIKEFVQLCVSVQFTFAWGTVCPAQLLLYTLLCNDRARSTSNGRKKKNMNRTKAVNERIEIIRSVKNTTKFVTMLSHCEIGSSFCPRSTVAFSIFTEIIEKKKLKKFRTHGSKTMQVQCAHNDFYKIASNLLLRRSALGIGIVYWGLFV